MPAGSARRFKGENNLLITKDFSTHHHNGATYLERLDEIGTLEEGKRADFVLVRGRPDQRISDIRNIEIVFKNGIGFGSEALLESVLGTIGD